VIRLARGREQKKTGRTVLEKRKLKQEKRQAEAGKRRKRDRLQALT